jgi:hypothetical protein
VGNGNYTVKQGECIESIAFKHGHFWQTVWDHPNNQQLRSARTSHNVLLPGDKVFVPDLRQKQETGATAQRHRFRRKGVPCRLVMIFKHEDQPRANVPYVLEVDGKLFSGKTDAQGGIRHPVPPNARRGKITLGTGDETEEYYLRLGGLDPITEVSGIQQRLRKLGFGSGEVDGVLGPETQAAIRAFQAKHGLNETGEPDQATRDKLKQEHGS